MASGLSHPAVLIFGAGASRGGLSSDPISPPIDGDFFDIAGQITGHGTRDLVKRVLKSLWDLYGKTTGIGLEEYYRDIETRAKISEIAKTHNKPKDWDRRRRELEELIRRVYIHTTMDLNTTPPKPLESEVHRLILKQLKPGCTVITFNYDLLIEESFESAKLWNPKNGYGMQVFGIGLDWARKWLENRKYRQGTESKIQILKLHGSLGWFLYANRKIRLKGRPYSVRKGKFEKISVLPPGWNKRIDRNPYRAFWGQARRQLEQCRSLMILGYSLPETDLLARSLFAEVVRTRVARKEYLQQLYLVDPSEIVKNRFVEMFKSALGPYGTVFRFDSMEQLRSRLKEKPTDKV